MELPDKEFLKATRYRINMPFTPSSDMMARIVRLDPAAIGKYPDAPEWVQSVAVQADFRSIAFIRHPTLAMFRMAYDSLHLLKIRDRHQLFCHLMHSYSYPSWSIMDPEGLARQLLLHTRIRNIEQLPYPTESEQMYVTSRMHGWSLVPYPSRPDYLLLSRI